MLVSVIIPTYKPDDYIYRCLDSLLKQTLDHRSYEIIIVLNGCNEPYYSLLLKYIEGKENTPVIKILQTNISGVSNARNIGILNSSGKFVAFIDDDDWVSSNYLYNLLKESGDSVIVVSNVKQIDEIRRMCLPHFLSRAYKRCYGKKHLSFFIARSFLSTACVKLIPRKVIEQDLFDIRFQLGEDALFMFVISKRIKNIKLASPDTVYYINKRQDSISHRTYSYLFRVHLAFSLSWCYVYRYMSSPIKYDFLFFLTRVFATLRKLFQKKYEE